MFVLFFIKIASILLAIVGVTFTIPAAVALYCGEMQVLPAFIIPLAISLVLALAINLPTRKFKYNMTIRETFFVVAFVWIIASFMGSVPLYFSGYFNSYIDAFFESVPAGRSFMHYDTDEQHVEWDARIKARINRWHLNDLFSNGILRRGLENSEFLLSPQKI